MELLVFKTGPQYIRVKDGRYSTVGLDKASVFPFDRIVQVKAKLADVQNSGYPDAAIYRLSMTETPL